MTVDSKTTVRLFDKFALAIPAKMTWQQDGIPGRRVLFISDKKETFTVSFEESMELMDLQEDTAASAVRFQCWKDGKSIHLKRNSSGKIVCAFFHIELKDDDGNAYSLPGQMVVCSDYRWIDGIEPVLMELLNGITACNTKDDNSET